MMKLFYTGSFLFILTASLELRAQSDTLTNESVQATQTAPKAPAPKATSAPKKNTATNVLDFEGEVIEGERRRPDLFLQMSIDNVKFDSLIYQRDDFNDYLEVDRKSRTRYLKLK